MGTPSLSFTTTPAEILRVREITVPSRCRPMAARLLLDSLVHSPAAVPATVMEPSSTAGAHPNGLPVFPPAVVAPIRFSAPETVFDNGLRPTASIGPWAAA